MARLKPATGGKAPIATPSRGLSAEMRVNQPPWWSVLLTLLGLVGIGIAIAAPGEKFRFAGALTTYATCGIPAFLAAARDLRRFRLNIDLLMILAALGAAALGDWREGAILLFLFALSNTLEAYALYRTTRSIDALIQLRPRIAHRVDAEGREVDVGLDALLVGDLVRVRPGEAFPVDGTVIAGETWANEATLTGESEPIVKSTGDEVFAGTLNGAGNVTVRTVRALADTRLETIVRLVREAQAAQTPTQRFVESWQGPYVAGVLAATVFVIVGSWMWHDRNWSDAFYHGMVLMVAMSPCALVIGGPAVTLSAIARAALRGVLFKGGAFLEVLGEVNAMAFDKTGTITQGCPRVTDVWVTDGTRVEEILSAAAAVEQRSEHHLATALVEEAHRRGVEIQNEVHDFHAHVGLGVHGNVGDQWVGVGHERLFQSHEVEVKPEVRAAAERLRGMGKTALLVIVHERSGGTARAGVIGVADTPRPEARRTLDALRELGIRHLVILTGDHASVTRSIAEMVGADRVVAGLLPEEKVAELRRLAGEGWRLAMVGDGVNDAPALAVADVGIAMGGAGTDVALEVADVVLMRDDLAALPFAVWLGRKAVARVRQNLLFASAIIGLLVFGSFFGLPLWLGVVGHEGSTLLVVFNGLRLLWERPSQVVADAQRVAANARSEPGSADADGLRADQAVVQRA